MRETQETIGRWAHANSQPTDGSDGVKGPCLKLIEEAVELAIAAGCTSREIHMAFIPKLLAVGMIGIHDTAPTPDTVPKKLGDCRVACDVIVHRLGVDGDEEKDGAMATNRTRRQAARPDGSAQHILDSGD